MSVKISQGTHRKKKKGCKQDSIYLNRGGGITDVENESNISDHHPNIDRYMQMLQQT